jgi:ectoine hydroxylase-related dioxygenase (phytanoyl-CoA dioxygenase family)
MPTTSYALTEDQIAAYRMDGAICLRRVFDPTEVSDLRSAVDDAMSRPGPFAQDFSAGNGGGFFADLFVWNRVRRLREMIVRDCLGEIAGRLMGARQVRLFYDHLLVKEPGSSDPTPWHQDAPYWPIEGRQCCSVWIALDTVTRDNGLVEYVRGTHASGELYAPKSFHGDSRLVDPDLKELPDIEACRNDYSIVSWDLEPGDVAIHDFRTIHGAPGNLTAKSRRRGLAVRWIGDDIVYRMRPGVPVPMSESLKTLAPGLTNGEPLDHPTFPVVWEAADR